MLPAMTLPAVVLLHMTALYHVLHRDTVIQLSLLLLVALLIQPALLPQPALLIQPALQPALLIQLALLTALHQAAPMSVVKPYIHHLLPPPLSQSQPQSLIQQLVLPPRNHQLHLLIRQVVLPLLASILPD